MIFNSQSYKKFQAKLPPLLGRSLDSWFILMRLTLPAMLVVRVLMWFDLVPLIAKPFEPLMALMGLPPEVALVWVVGMFTNIYAVILSWASLLPVIGPLDVIQATVLGSICLIAHNLPVEGQVCRGADVSPLRMTMIRFFGAIIYGIMLFQLARLFGLGTGEAVMQYKITGEAVPPWGLWFWQTAKSMVFIFFIITALMVVMDIFKKLNLIRLVGLILGPPLKLAGIGESALMITVIGNLMGLAYGGGLIIAESQSGQVKKADVYGSIVFMVICHSVIEDTLLIMSTGASLWGILVGRIGFGLLATAIITRMVYHPLGQAVWVGRKYKF